MLERTYELPEAFVELVHNEAVKRNARVEQPEKCDCWHQRDTRASQSNDIVFARLLFEYLAFSEPAIGGECLKVHTPSIFGHVCHLDQSVNHADPHIGRIALVACV